MEKRIGWLVVILAFFFSVHAFSDVDDTLRSLAGHWNGTVTINSGDKKGTSYKEKLSFQPVFNNQFLMTDVKAQKSPGGKSFSGKGFLMYDGRAGKYFFYWFDTDGFHGKYEGQRQDHTLTFNMVDPAGSGKNLTMTLKKSNEFTVTLQDGSSVIQTMNFQKG